MDDITLRRRSSRNYDPSREISQETIDKLLESIRWAPSSRNRQPWRYIVFDHRTPSEKEVMLELIMEGNRAWAKNAPLLILSIAQIVVDGREYPIGYHDLGLANENLMLSAVNLGLNIRPMGGFDKAGAIEKFRIPSDFKPIAVFSIGYPAPIGNQSESIKEKEKSIRSRKEISEFSYLGSLNSPYPDSLQVEKPVN